MSPKTRIEKGSGRLLVYLVGAGALVGVAFPAVATIFVEPKSTTAGAIPEGMRREDRGRIPPERYAELAAFAAAVDQLQERPVVLAR